MYGEKIGSGLERTNSQRRTLEIEKRLSTVNNRVEDALNRVKNVLRSTIGLTENPKPEITQSIDIPTPSLESIAKLAHTVEMNVGELENLVGQLEQI